MEYKQGRRDSGFMGFKTRAPGGGEGASEPIVLPQATHESINILLITLVNAPSYELFQHLYCIFSKGLHKLFVYGGL